MQNTIVGWGGGMAAGDKKNQELGKKIKGGKKKDFKNE